MLDVSDVNIFCIEENARDSFLVQEMKEKFRKRFNERYLKKAQSFEKSKIRSKEVILSYKTIYRNTYDILVVDLYNKTSSKNFVFRHETFHLWEN